MIRNAAAVLAFAAALAFIAFAAPASGQSGIVCSRTGGGEPYRFQSWEGERSRSLILDAQSLAAANRLFPDDPEFALPALEIGLGDESAEDPAAAIPAPILYAIGWIESKANQTALDVDYGDSGPALVSSDCGYGVMQVTTGFINDDERPTRWESLVGSHFAYNVAAGAKILADKWNDTFFPVVGIRDPRYIESWYYAIWSYNGWAGANHPGGPEVDQFRSSPYPCNERRNGYPYQELVLGCIINPPEVDGIELWPSSPVQLPDPGLLFNSGPLDHGHFLNGWTDLRRSVSPRGDGPFSLMNMSLPSAAVTYADEGAAARSPADARARVLGEPRLSLPAQTVHLGSGAASGRIGVIVIANAGSGLLPWRVRHAPDWVVLSHDAGVALGDDRNWPAAPSRRASRLEIRADAAGVVPGAHLQQIRLEAMLPDGSIETRAITVELNKSGPAFYAAGEPES